MIEVGKDVVCVKSHSREVVKKGEIYTVEGIRKNMCGCIVLDVGIKRDLLLVGQKAFCSVCKKLTNDIDGKWWLYIELFAPLQTDSEEADMEEALAELGIGELELQRL